MNLNTERFLPRIEKIGDTSISGNAVFKEKFFTLSIEWKSITELIDGKYEPKVKMIYWLNSYKENSMKIRVIDPKIISNIEPSRLFQEETKESWKKFLSWLFSLWRKGELKFDSEETKSTFFDEHGNWASK